MDKSKPYDILDRRGLEVHGRRRPGCSCTARVSLPHATSETLIAQGTGETWEAAIYNAIDRYDAAIRGGD